MGDVWDKWVEKIIEERESLNPTERRRGFIRQLATELIIYALVGMAIAIVAIVFDILTGFKIINNTYKEIPTIVTGTTIVLFSKAWDSWIRVVQDDESAEAEVDEDMVQTTLDADTEGDVKT